MTHHVLKATPPVRAFIVGDLALLAGVVLAIASLAQHWPTALLVSFAIVAVLGAALIGLAFATMRRNRVDIVIDERGYQLLGPGLRRSGEWADVTKVTRNHDGTRLVFHHRDRSRTQLFVPGSVETPQMKALIADIAQHLDDDRGYRPFVA